MPWHDGGQSAMMAAIDHGPAHLPGGLFAGTAERVLAGMKVHANTISHARLVALEETFPRTRSVIGHDRFNAHSRLFLREAGVTARALANIGAGFDAFLITTGEDAGASDLARFEWLWLQSYHAADAAPLALSDLAGLPPDDVLDQVLVRHPAAYAAPLAAVLQAVIGAEVEGLDDAAAILITRPDAEVLVAPATTVMHGLFAAAQYPRSIGNLLALRHETEGEADDPASAAMPALVALIHAGALIRADC